MSSPWTALAGTAALLAALLLSAPAAAEKPGELQVNPVLASIGSEYYVQYCASCHGMGGRGDGPVASSLNKRPSDLTTIAQRRDGDFPEAEIAAYIDGRFELDAHGTRDMPIWGRRFGGERIAEGVDPEEIVRGRLQILVEYLKSIQRTSD